MYNRNSVEVDYRINRSEEKTFFDNAFRDLSRLSHTFSEIVERDQELEWMSDRLLCKFKPNILIVGESGVGKTALVEGLATYARNATDLRIKNLKFIEFNVGELIAGTSYRGDFEKKIVDLLKFLIQDNHTVLFIDEAHALAMTGDVHGGGVDALNLLKPFLTTGQIRCILASTPQEAQSLTKDRAFMRRFALLNLKTLSSEGIEKALRAKGKYLKHFHNLEFNENIYSFVQKNYIQKNFGLDSAIDFLDEVLASFSRNQEMSMEQIMERVFMRYMTSRSFFDAI